MTSKYLQIVDLFCRKYRLVFFDKLKLLLIYPFYKVIWFHLTDSKKVHGQILKRIIHVMPKLSFNLKIFSSYNQKIILPISLEPADFDSFKEIFWGDTYPLINGIENCTSLVDIGSNTGMCSFYLLANLPLKKITLVEANPKLYKLLKRRFAKQIFPDLDLEVINACVSDKSNQQIFFKVAKNHRNSKIVSEKENFTHILPTLAFDNLKDADILKIDIEGEEINLLKKFPHVFAKYKYIYIELHGDKNVRADARRIFSEIGFKNQTITASDEICEVVAMSRV